jgi:hypothetical protein
MGFTVIVGVVAGFASEVVGVVVAGAGVVAGFVSDAEVVAAVGVVAAGVTT